MFFKYLFLMFSVLFFCCGPAEKEPAPIPQYELVEGWPQLPDSITLGAVTGVVVDSQDRIYILHRGEHPVLCFTREGKLIYHFGDNQINVAHGLEIAPDNTIWITDVGDHIVMQFSPEGRLLRTLGTKGKPGETENTFDKPTDVTFTPSGEFYVTDGYGNFRVVKFSADYKFQFAWGDSGTGDGQFNLPHAADVDSRGRVFVCDRENSRMQIFSPGGDFITMWTHIGQPWGVYITGDERIFVVDGRNGKAMLLNIEGEIITSWGSLGAEPGQFDFAHDVAADSHGDVYITEINNKRVQKYREKQ